MTRLIPTTTFADAAAIVKAADRGVIKYDTEGLSTDEFSKKLVKLMKQVMRRNSGPHWTEELKQLYKECENGQKNI